MVKRIIILLFVFSSILSFGQANRFAGFGSRNTCPTEAQKFIDSSGITDATEKSAICTLVKQLKDSSLWVRMKVIYPIVGGASSTVKWNLVNPVNSNTANRLSLFGGWTITSTYIQGNGVNTYANTFIQSPNYLMTKDSTCFGIYIKNNVNGTGSAFGGLDNSYQGWALSPRYINNTYVALVNVYAALANTDASGFWIGSRISTTSAKTFRNGTTFMTNGNSFISAYYDIYLGARNLGGTLESPSTYQIGFFFFSSGLTDAEAVTMNNIFQTFKTTLGK